MQVVFGCFVSSSDDRLGVDVSGVVMLYYLL